MKVYAEGKLLKEDDEKSEKKEVSSGCVMQSDGRYLHTIEVDGVEVWSDVRDDDDAVNAGDVEVVD